ncbi:MAG: hypothetical protein KBH71_09035 [Anaerolineae bacterium]|mgnify:FL=1|nr:hypothetical protein [Anaerolineae bacterium]HPD42033.1 hypothetical protein [Anaerolineae bacterium]HRT31992.1 hypothetical protein [Anaerolineae bacterium]HXK43233.1 hypothetical protein [Anaerolineae bacterium]
MTDEVDLNAVMHAYAEEAVALARAEFAVALEYSALSLADADQILAAIHDALPQNSGGDFDADDPLQQWVQELAVIWGAYVGEVLLHDWGGEWTLDVPPERAEAAAVQIGDFLIYPISKAYQRLISSRDAGLVVFYEEVRWQLSQNGERGPRIMPAVAG